MTGITDKTASFDNLVCSIIPMPTCTSNSFMLYYTGSQTIILG